MALAGSECRMLFTRSNGSVGIVLIAHITVRPERGWRFDTMTAQIGGRAGQLYRPRDPCCATRTKNVRKTVTRAGNGDVKCQYAKGKYLHLRFRWLDIRHHIRGHFYETSATCQGREATVSVESEQASGSLHAPPRVEVS